MARRNVTTEQLQRQLEEAQRQAIIAENRVLRLQNRARHSRKAKDRRRTHRLIQYGVAFECNETELAALTDVEVYTFVESLLQIPEVQICIRQAIDRHRADHAEYSSESATDSQTDTATVGGSVTDTDAIRTIAFAAEGGD